MRNTVVFCPAIAAADTSPSRAIARRLPKAVQRREGVDTAEPGLCQWHEDARVPRKVGMRGQRLLSSALGLGQNPPFVRWSAQRRTIVRGEAPILRFHFRSSL